MRHTYNAHLIWDGNLGPAHAECYVASSCRVPIIIDATCLAESSTPRTVEELAS